MKMDCFVKFLAYEGSLILTVSSEECQNRNKNDIGMSDFLDFRLKCAANLIGTFCSLKIDNKRHFTFCGSACTCLYIFIFTEF